MSFELKKSLVFKLSETELSGPVTYVLEGKVIVYRGEGDVLRATWNRCKHQGGKFGKSSDCILTCPVHGWKLDVSQMVYVNPQGGLKQQELIVEKSDDGTISIYEKVAHQPWGDCKVSELQPWELSLRFYSHACAEIRAGSRSLFTDPWLTGPAFTRGWWLVHKAPDDWLESLSKADGIYISHNHSDHLNLPTLKRLARVNPRTPVYIPAFESDSCEMLLKEAGMQDIRIIPFDIWQPWGEHGRFMILRDGAGRDDSGLLFEYKGHRILNVVDCANLNHGILPHVKVLLSAFASGASGYPICWNEQYSEDHIAQYLKRDRLQLLRGVVETAKQVHAKIVVPFAGYFTEAHPSDAFVKRLNIKNTPEDLKAAISKSLPEAYTWIPISGARLDVSSGQIEEGRLSAHGKPEYEFEQYLGEIRDSASLPVLGTEYGIRAYFEWAGFRSDIVLHIIETDDDFQQTFREFIIDLSDLKFLSERPSKSHRYERLKVRKDVFRHVLRHGMSWEEITIGFQGRFYRDPDRYNMDFWGHFQNKLPKVLPDWEALAKHKG